MPEITHQCRSITILIVSIVFVGIAIASIVVLATKDAGDGELAKSNINQTVLEYGSQLDQDRSDWLP